MLVEFGGEPTHLVALPTALFDQVGVQHLDDVAMRRHPCGEAVDGADVPLDREPLPFRRDARLGVRRETAFGLVEPSLEELLAFVEPGVVNLEILSSRGERSRTSFEFGAQFPTSPSGVRLGLFIGLERRQQRVELADALLVAHDVGGDVVDRPFEVLQFRLDLTMLALRLSKPLGRSAEAGIVGIEATHELGFGRTGGLQRRVRIRRPPRLRSRVHRVPHEPVPAHHRAPRRSHRCQQHRPSIR